MKKRTYTRILLISIAVLALADGVLHLLLDFVLFGGRNGPPSGPRLGAPPSGPPPGARPFPFILPLNQLFILNFIGEVVLVLLFVISRRWFGRRRWWVDVAMIAYAAITFGAWLAFGRPNPMGLGYLSKGIELVLIIALLADLWLMRRQRIVPADGNERSLRS